jgi:hypothetical protein
MTTKGSHMTNLGKLSIPALLIVSGCASTPAPCPGPEVVEIVRTTYVQIPAHLSTYPAVPVYNIATNGDLLEAYRAWKEAAEDRGRRLDEVRELR